mgnify:FL=1
MQFPVIHPEAEEEVGAAVDYWELRSPGLGNDLALQWMAALRTIQSNPRLHPLADDAPIGEEVRNYLLRGLSYRVICLVEDSELMVLAFAHTKRRPGYWLARLT